VPLPHVTALQNTCILETPSPLINAAFRYAKDNVARCMRYYTLGWGMSNAPHNWAIVVGRDTGWMTVGADYVAGWFAPSALKAFRDRQKPNGQILEYIDLESGFGEDYGLNIADNTPLYIWGVWHHWKQYHSEVARQQYHRSIVHAADYLLAERGPHGLLVGVPAGVETRGITSWRNIIPGKVMAGESTEINSLTSMALRMAAELTGETRYADAARDLAAAINRELWTGDSYLLTRYDDHVDNQVTGDAVFPLITGVAPPDRARKVLDRLSRKDFWTERGMRTVPNTDPAYHPSAGAGLIGGSWPNLTLWYAAAIAPYNPDAALRALEIVARPAVEEMDPAINVRQTEFSEYFDGDTGINLGMHLSPWVAPTFIWAVMEGLLGMQWNEGRPSFHPQWPTGWEQVSVRALPTASGRQDRVMRRKES
jgi:glycogen debranching enzyme